MPEGGLTSANSLRCLPHKTAGRNNLEQESNAVLDYSGLDLKKFVLPKGLANSKEKNKCSIESTRITTSNFPIPS